jgi:hypothetical protein
MTATPRLGVVRVALVLGALAFAPAAFAADAFAPVHIPVTAETFRGIDRTAVDVTEEDGTKAHFEGVALGDVLTAHGVQLGRALRGPALAHYVVVKAADGYRAVYARAGPFRIVVPGEKHEARWVRQVTEIDVESAP